MDEKQLIIDITALIIDIDNDLSIEEFEDLSLLCGQNKELERLILSKITSNKLLKLSFEDKLLKIKELFNSIDYKDKLLREDIFKLIIFFILSDNIIDEKEKQVLYFFKEDYAVFYNKMKLQNPNGEEVFIQLKSFFNKIT